MNTVISVIIPAYKAAKYIQEALNGLRNQEYTDWDLIVIEDGSKDNTENIVHQFANEVPNSVTYLTHKINKGLAATRNTGIKNAKGKYIAYLDHDDIWEKNHLKNSLELLKKHHGDLVYSTTICFENQITNVVGSWGPSEQELKDFPKSLYYRNFITPSSVVMKTEISNELGYFDEDIRSCEDWDYWIRLAKHNKKFLHSKEQQCYYRQHTQSLAKDYKVMTETELHVMRKNKDWDIISDKEKREREKNLYKQLANIYSKKYSKLSIKKLSLFLKTAIEYPFDVNFLGNILRSL